jgi:glycosyltransferase involved in cell wall biosynthesis
MMKPLPKVSVVMTCYKYAQYLPKAIESVLNQTYPNLEVIMVNDGSPDNTDEVMQPYLADPRVRYIKQPNSGQTIAKNNGIAAATGEYIAFLDADDIWDLRKLEKQMPLFANPRVGIVYSGMDQIDDAGNPAPYEVTALSRPRAGRIVEALFADNIVPFSAAVARRECFEKVGVMDTSLRMAIDWDLWLRMSVHYEFDFVDEPLLHYRIGHPNQMSKNYFVRAKDTMRIMENFITANPDLLPRPLVRWVMAYSHCNRGYRYRPIDGWTSLKHYLQALSWRWYHFEAYSGIARLLVVRALMPFGFRRNG